jgi:hypothetical protein
MVLIKAAYANSICIGATKVRLLNTSGKWSSVNYNKPRKCISYNTLRKCKNNGVRCTIWSNTEYVRYSTIKTRVKKKDVKIRKKERVYLVCDTKVRRYIKPVTLYIIEKRHKQVSGSTDRGSTAVRTEGRICVEDKRLCDWNMNAEKCESYIYRNVCYVIVDIRCISDKNTSAVKCGSKVPRKRRNVYNTKSDICNKNGKVNKCDWNMYAENCESYIYRKVYYVIVDIRCISDRNKSAVKCGNNVPRKRMNVYNTRSNVCNKNGKVNKCGRMVYPEKNVPVIPKIIRSGHEGRVNNVYQTVRNIPACLKMSAGGNDVEMADPLTTGQKGAYKIVVYKLQSSLKNSCYRTCVKVMYLVRSSSNPCILTHLNYIVKNVSCRAVISLDCLYLLSYHPSIYQHVREDVRDPVGFTSLGKRLLRVHKFIIWCKRYGE